MFVQQELFHWTSCHRLLSRTGASFDYDDASLMALSGRLICFSVNLWMSFEATLHLTRLRASSTDRLVVSLSLFFGIKDVERSV